MEDTTPKGPKYVKGDQTWSIEGASTEKLHLIDREGGESIWVAWPHAGDEVALINHALAFYPFPSWGLILPRTKEFDADTIKKGEIANTVFTLHPEAYDSMVEKELLDANGRLTPKAFEDYA